MKIHDVLYLVIHKSNYTCSV